MNFSENLVDGVWNPKDYLNLNSPQSPCISTQWTYRDGELVDLPTVLMVKGDVILLRPGHAVPVQCQELMVSSPFLYFIQSIIITGN